MDGKIVQQRPKGYCPVPAAAVAQDLAAPSVAAVQSAAVPLRSSPDPSAETGIEQDLVGLVAVRLVEVPGRPATSFADTCC
jgi:hypothetical protein